MPEDRTAVIGELYRRRDQLSPEKRAIVDELAKRHNIQAPVTSAAGEAPPERTWGDSAADFLGAAWGKVNPVKQLEGLAAAATDLPGAAKGMLNAQGDLAMKAQESFKSGDYLGGVRHSINYLIPLLGLEMDVAGNKLEQGKIAEGLGETAGIGANIALPAAIGKLKNIPLGLSMENPSPVKQAAANWAEAQKPPIPLSAGAVTDNPVVKFAEKGSGSTPLGSLVDVSARKATGEALASKGAELAQRAHPEMVVRETAGEALSGGMEKTISMLKEGADVEYAPFNAATKNPANKRTIQVGERVENTGVVDAQGSPITRKVPITKDVVIPVDMRPFKQGLQPLYEEMQQWLEPAKRDASAGFQAIKSIVEGEDFVAAKVAEKGLGGLKRLSRESMSSDTRNFSEGIAAKVGPDLQTAIDTAVDATAGPKALAALQRGRKTHSLKMDAADTLEELQKASSEPVAWFNRATLAGDAGIERLRNLALYAPKEMPKLGRAYLEGLLETATMEGGFGKSSTVFNKWHQLGPETKKLIFPDQQLVSDLDNFFQAAKMQAENPNPSGSAIGLHSLGTTGLTVANPVTGVAYILGQGALAKLLHSRAGVALLTKGLKIPLGNTVGATAVTSQVLKMAGDDVQKIEPEKKRQPVK